MSKRGIKRLARNLNLDLDGLELTVNGYLVPPHYGVILFYDDCRIAYITTLSEHLHHVLVKLGKATGKPVYSFEFAPKEAEDKVS